MVTQAPTSVELAGARAKLYQLLSSVYIGPPDLDFLKFLAGWVSSSIGDGPSHLLSQQIRHSLYMLNGFFKKLEEGSQEELREAVSVEFTRLFRGVKPLYSPLPPYESVYREESGCVFGDLTVEVHREYRRFGLDLADGLTGEPPDHLSFELDFMHLLCSLEAKAWDRDDEDEALRFLLAEKEFLEKHLMKWLPRFCGEVRKHDRLGLFRCLADLTEGWISLDYQQYLQEIKWLSNTSLPQGSLGPEYQVYKTQ